MIRNEVVKLLKKTLLSGMLTIFFTACSPETSSEQDYFQDEALESSVLQELEMEAEDITEENLATIESLDASDAGITNLDGI